MEIRIIFKIATIGILISVINQLLKASGREELSFYVTLCGIIMVIYLILPILNTLFTTLETMLEIS